MQDRAERAENRDARLRGAKDELREALAAGKSKPLALAIYRCRLLALNIHGADLRAELSAVTTNNVIALRR